MCICICGIFITVFVINSLYAAIIVLSYQMCILYAILEQMSVLLSYRFFVNIRNSTSCTGVRSSRAPQLTDCAFTELNLPTV